MRPLVSSFGVLLILALAGCGGGGGGGTDSPGPSDPAVTDLRPAVGTYAANQVGKRYDTAGGSLVTAPATSGSVVATTDASGTRKLVFTTTNGTASEDRVLTVFINSNGIIDPATATLTVGGTAYTVTGASASIGNPVDALGNPLDPTGHPSDANDNTTYAIRVVYNHDQTSGSAGTLQERDSFLFGLPTGLFATSSVTVADNQGGTFASSPPTFVNSASGVSTKAYVARSGLVSSATSSNQPATDGISYRVVRDQPNPAPYNITNVIHNLGALKLQTDGTITGSLNLDFDYPAVGSAPAGHTTRSVTLNPVGAPASTWQILTSGGTVTGLKLTLSYFNPVYYTVSGTTSTFSLETDTVTLSK